ncbi:M56 family metallopeptidase [Acidobacteria bacterium AB60]|nr:M56 family metallopeptidase [Acidobacteria bacterium AB60]
MTHLLPSIAWTLIHFCWEAAAIAAVYGASSLLLSRRSSNARYTAALTALLLMMSSALVTFGLELRANGAFAREAGTARQTAAPAAMAKPEAGPHPFVPAASAISQDAALPSLPALLPWIDGFWLVGVFALSLRSLGGWWLIRRLSASASTAVPAETMASFKRIAATLGIKRGVVLAISGAVSGPATVGVLRATVLLPLCALTSLSADELEMVFAHELAHVRRADFFWNLIQTFAETVFFFHPAVWWIGGCLRNERELCCDDLALKICPNPVTYARALFRLEEQRVRQPRLAMALDGNGSRSTLRLRILRILGEPVAHMTHTPSRAFSISVAVAGLMLLVLPTSQVLASMHPAAKAKAAVAMASPRLAALMPQEAAPEPARPAAPSAPARPAVTVTPSPAVVTVTPAAPVTVAPVMPAAPAATMEVAPVVASTMVFTDVVTDSQDAPAGDQKPSAGERFSGHSTYIDRMRAAGYDVDLDKYLAMKVQGVTPEYAAAMNKLDFGKLSADDLVACKIQGVDPAVIAEMKKQGLDVKNVHDAISYKIFSVTPEFIGGMKAAGFGDLSSKQLVSLRVQGVTPEYARSITQQFPGATVDDVIKTKIFGIDANFIASAKSHGFGNLSLDKLVKLRISGLLDDEK